MASSLLTQCPHCQTSFRVTRSQLAVAEGQVRCGSCLGVFSARDNEIRVKPPQPPLLDQPLSKEELYAAALATDEEEDESDSEAVEASDAGDEENAEYIEYEDAPPARERTGSWLDYDEDEFEYEDEVVEDDHASHRNVEDEDDAEQDVEEEIHEEYVDGDEQEAIAEAREESFEEYADAIDEYADEPTLREPTLNLDDEPSFSAARDEDRDDPLFADDDQLEPGFSATDDDDGGDYRAVRARYVRQEQEDKRQVRRYVEELEDDEALDELDPRSLDYLDEEPLHIAPPPQPRRFWRNLLLGLGSIVLLGALVLQFIAANIEDFDDSARFALIKPFVCALIDCPEEVVQMPTTLITEQLVVRAHPTMRDALEVTAVLRNNGAATQPLPGLELIFRNAQEEIVASRVFTPEQYLPVELRTATTLPSQSSVQVKLELAHPGPDALNYELVFQPVSKSGRR